MSDSVERPRTSGLALASFRLGVLGLFLLLLSLMWIGSRWVELRRDPGLGGPLPELSTGQAVAQDVCLGGAVVAALAALVLGILGLAAVGGGAGQLVGRGLAVSGLVTGTLTLLPFVAVVAVGLAMAPEAAKDRSSNNLRVLSLAMLNYSDANWGRLPPAAVYSQDGKPLYSWRVLLLGSLGEKDLLRQFHFNEPWDSHHNRQFVEQMPRVFAHPLDPEGARQGLTHYQVFVGTDPEAEARPPFLSRNPPELEPFHLGLVPGGAPLFQARGAALRYPVQFTDDVAETILVAEAADAVPWTAPQDLTYSSRQPLPRLGGLFSGGYFVVMSDGKPRFVEPDRVSDQTLRDAITANDGRKLGPDW
jgi:hypothetical protein